MKDRITLLLKELYKLIALNIFSKCFPDFFEYFIAKKKKAVEILNGLHHAG